MKRISIVLSLFILASCATTKPKPVPQVSDLVGNYARPSIHETLTLNSDFTYIHSLLDSESRSIVSTGKWVYTAPPSAEDSKQENEGGAYSYGSGRTIITFYSWISSSSLSGAMRSATVWFEEGSPVILPMADSSAFSRN